jgi:hypothetical protein
VHVAPVLNGGDLYSRNRDNATTRSLGSRFVSAIRCVVIGDREYANARRSSPGHKLGGGQTTV